MGRGSPGIKPERVVVGRTVTCRLTAWATYSLGGGGEVALQSGSASGDRSMIAAKAEKFTVVEVAGSWALSAAVFKDGRPFGIH